MENMLNTIMEKLESMSEELTIIREGQVNISKDISTIRKEQVSLREDISTIKGEQTEFRVETRVNFNSLNDKLDTMNEEVNALVDSYGEITHRVKILNNRYTKDKSRNKDLL